ncbi:MAG: DUF4383 domain-containing protein [Actinomycetota bacterium]|nr:DUF4383 domain-containing protein [Actinomycetota bacterium]
MVNSSTTGRLATTRTPVQVTTLVFAVVFLLVGIAGFIPGVTTNYGDMSFAGHHPPSAMLFGVFAVSVLHNIVHLLFGIAGLALARSFNAARSYLIGGGVIYAVLWLYGLFVDVDSAANFVPLNTADNWLHLVLAVAMIGLGVVFGRRSATAGPTGERT